MTAATPRAKTYRNSDIAKEAQALAAKVKH